MLLMPAKRHIATEQKTLVLEKSGAAVPDWEQPVERLVEALVQDEFELYAQRIVALAKPKAAPMAEVLLRMRHEERMLPPGSFLPVFERCGMMPALDRWVMRRAIARLARGSRVPSLSLNISGQTLSDPDFPPAVGIGVIGECVESNEVLATLQAAGAGFAQGYGIHVPMPINEVLQR